MTTRRLKHGRTNLALWGAVGWNSPMLLKLASTYRTLRYNDLANGKMNPAFMNVFRSVGRYSAWGNNQQTIWAKEMTPYMIPVSGFFPPPKAMTLSTLPIAPMTIWQPPCCFEGELAETKYITFGVWNTFSCRNKGLLHLTWWEVWWSLGSYPSLFHTRYEGGIPWAYSIKTIYDLWWSFGLTHPCCPWSLHIYHYEAMPGQGPHFPAARKATSHIYRGEGEGGQDGYITWGGGRGQTWIIYGPSSGSPPHPLCHGGHSPSTPTSSNATGRQDKMKNLIQAR